MAVNIVPDPERSLFVNSTQLAERFGVSRKTIDGWRERGVIPYIRIRNIVRYDVNECRKALERRFKVRAAK
jgi:DNA-binding transcriptional MerR regulator